ncbi:MAG: TlpA disulfide reductase family protein [Isosphaeraceae bacterium]
MNRWAFGLWLGFFPLATFAQESRDLKKQGLFGFPQAEAKVLCDTKDLRVSSWNDAAHLYVQAIVWGDGDDALGETSDGRPIGDSGSLIVDADADGQVMPKVDRTYTLNPWPKLPGLRYSVSLGGGASTALLADSEGRGSIHYQPPAVGKGNVRVDSFVIPLAELNRKAGDKVRIAYYASSTSPKLTLNSVGFEKDGPYYPHNLPFGSFHELTLADRPVSLDIQPIPDGRETEVPLEKAAIKPMPEKGSIPPEIAAKDWINADRPQTLAALKGKVVVIDFWATWCGPCVAGIPLLNALHDEYGPKGLVIVSLTDQSKTGIENFRKGTPMKYILGTGSESAAEYGVTTIPHVFLVGRDGKLAWHGNPNDQEFDPQLKAAMDAR